MKRVQEVISRLNTLLLPVAENEFIITKQNPPPDPPYIIWFEDVTEAGGGDTVVLFKKRKIVVELYTERFGNKMLEQKIESDVLYDVKYTKYQAPVESEDLVQTAYEFYITEKLPKGERKYG